MTPGTQLGDYVGSLCAQAVKVCADIEMGRSLLDAGVIADLTQVRILLVDAKVSAGSPTARMVDETIIRLDTALAGRPRPITAAGSPGTPPPVRLRVRFLPRPKPPAGAHFRVLAG